MHILVRLSTFEKDIRLRFNSYEHLYSMFGIESTITQTTSNLILAFHN